MNSPEPLIAFFAAARHCAMEMAGNALYIRNELPRVALPPGVEEILNDACDELVSAKFDLFSDLSDLDDLLGTDPVHPAVLPKATHILEQLDAAAVLLQSVVMMLREAAAEDSRYHLAFLLVAESAVNMLNAHGAVPRFGRRQIDPG
jgi:hypothetical protein